MRDRVPLAERGGPMRGVIDLVSGRYPRFVFGGRIGRDLLPLFHFHDVARADLEPKLRYLVENGYRTVNADDIEAYVAGRARFDDRRVGLCFDDAWASLWTVAAPLLRTYGLTAITYAIPGRMAEATSTRPTLDGGASAPTGPPFVTWPELTALHASGIVDVQSHTDSHSMIFCSDEISGFVTPEYMASTPLLNRPQLCAAPLRFLSADELGAPLYLGRSRMSSARRVLVSAAAHERCVALVAGAGGPSFFSQPGWRHTLLATAGTPSGEGVEPELERERAIEDELDRSRSILNARLRTTCVNHVCLPWGVSSESAAAAVRRLGYRTAIANRWRGVMAARRGDDPFWLKRLPNRYIYRLPTKRQTTS